MEPFNEDSLFDAAMMARLSRKFTRGSLWWVSEAVWHTVNPIAGRPFQSESASHPGAILTNPLDDETVRIIPGRTPMEPQPAAGEVFMRMRPFSRPNRWTKFGGRGRFIGWMNLNWFLTHEGSGFRAPPAPGEMRVERNAEVPSLNESQLATLARWNKPAKPDEPA